MANDAMLSPMIEKSARDLINEKLEFVYGDVRDQNYLTAGYHVGINTVGQSLRNANLQLRSEIPNPQNAVGPWMISTIEPDLRQNVLEIGSSISY